MAFKTPAGHNPSRRFSQPVAIGGYGDRGRRVSDPAHSLMRGLEGPAPGTMSLTAQLEEKIVAEKSARKARGEKDSTTFDSEHYNPDGSLRTVHKMPKFTDAYAEASKARYIRHKSPTDREKELSVNQVFEKAKE